MARFFDFPGPNGPTIHLNLDQVVYASQATGGLDVYLTNGVKLFVGQESVEHFIERLERAPGKET